MASNTCNYCRRHWNYFKLVQKMLLPPYSLTYTVAERAQSSETLETTSKYTKCKQNKKDHHFDSTCIVAYRSAESKTSNFAAN